MANRFGAEVDGHFAVDVHCTRPLFGGAESAIVRIANHAAAEFPLGQVGRSVRGAVIHHDHFELGALLPAHGCQARAQQLAPFYKY